MNNRLQDIIIKNAELALTVKFPAESTLVKFEWPEVLGLMSTNILELENNNQVLNYFNNSVFTRFFEAFAPELFPYILEKSVEEYHFREVRKNDIKEKNA